MKTPSELGREQDRQMRAAPDDIPDETQAAESVAEAASVNETVHRSRESVRLAFVLVSAGLVTAIIAATVIYYTRKPSSHGVPAVVAGQYESNDKDLAISVGLQEWKAIPKGSEFKTKSGRAVTITDNLAGVTIAVRIRNRTAFDTVVEAPIILVGRNGSPVTTFRLVKRGGRTLERWPDGGLEVPAGEYVLLELQSTFKDYEDLSRAQPLAIELPNHDIRSGLEALPPWKVLCEKRRNLETQVN